MPDYLSDGASFSVDDDTGSLTDISAHVNSVDMTGGNDTVENTGLGDDRRSEQRDIGAIMTMSINGRVNSTTDAIFGAWLEGTSAVKTVDFSPDGSQHYTGEATVGAVSYSVPIGLQTFSAEFRSSDSTGFNRTSVAAT